METGQRVLVVDDEILLTYSVSEYLLGEGFDVKETTSPEKALLMLDNEHFDVVVTDLRMMPFSGIDIIKHLRSSGFKGRIVVMSAYFNEFEKDLRELKVDALLEKPFKLSKLLECVKTDHKSLIQT